MSTLELLAPETAEATPFRLAERPRVTGADGARAARDRRAHERRTATDLEWLEVVRLTGGTGYDVNIIDLSEGGALLESVSPLRPGLVLTLEMTGPGLYTTVPLEVLRCYIASLRGDTAMYRGAVAFAQLIHLPGKGPRCAAVAADFVGTDRAVAHLLERCLSLRQAGASGVSLDRTEVLGVLGALRARTATRGSDVLSRHFSDLLAAILPALHDEAPREVALAALEENLRGLPGRWRSLLEPTIGRLEALIDLCVTAAEEVSSSQNRVALPVIWSNPTMAASPPGSDVAPPAATDSLGSTYQKIVVRHAGGRILKGYTQDFHPSRPQFSLWPSINATPSERSVVPVSQLKAVFFVKDFTGNPAHQDRKDFGAGSSQGRRVEITFTDGESVLGTTLSYRRDGQGFFVSPADPGTNNTRIYVVAKAVRLVRFL